MYYLLLTTLLTILPHFNFELIAPDENYKQYEELSVFSAKFFSDLSKGPDINAVILYVEEDEAMTKFYDKISKELSRLTVITIELKNYTVSINGSLGFRPEVTIIFLNKNTYNNVEEIIFNVEVFPIWNVRSKFFLVASEVDTEDNAWIEETFRQFWHRQVRHVVLCFWDESIKVFTFNPFYDQFSIEIPAEANVAGILNEKIRKMNGYKLKLFNMDSIYKGRIEEALFNGKKTYLGMDGIFFSTVSTLLSASLELHELSNDFDITSLNQIDTDTPLNDFLDTMREIYDFDVLCNAVGVFSGTDNLDHIFQSERDDVYFLIPRAQQIPRYLYLFLMIPLEVWFGVGVSLVVTSGVLWVIRRNGWWRMGRRNVLLDNFGILFNQSINKTIEKFQERLIIVTWLIHCIIVTTILQSTLMTSFISPKFYDEIDDLEDLYKSGIKIYGAHLVIKKLFDNFDIEELRKAIIPIPKSLDIYGLNTDWIKHYAHKKHSGLMVFLEQHLYLQTIPQLRNKHHRMKDCIMPYIRAYWIPKDKIFYGELLDTMGLIEQAGLFRYWKQFNYGIVAKEELGNDTMEEEKDLDSSQEMALQVQHLQLGFMLLVAGYILALGVFVGEMLMNKVKRMCKKKKKKKKSWVEN